MLLGIEGPRRGDPVGYISQYRTEFKGRLAKTDRIDIRHRRRQTTPKSAAYLLIEEHMRLAVR